MAREASRPVDFRLSKGQRISFAADELPVRKDGTVEVSWWREHPVQVLTPASTRLVPQQPLPREVTLLPSVEESDDQAVLELARSLPPEGN